MAPSAPGSPPDSPPDSTSVDAPLVFDDPTYRDAVVALLGAVSYGEISAFDRLAVPDHFHRIEIKKLHLSFGLGTPAV